MDDSGSIGQIVILVTLIGLSGLFSASETAFSSVNKMRLKNYANKGNKKAIKAMSMVDDYDGTLSTVLIGNNIVNIGAASIGTLLFTNMFGPSGVAISTACMTVLVLIFGEIFPKTYAKSNPENIAMKVTPFLSVLSVILKPFLYLVRKMKKSMAKVMNSDSTAPSMTEMELKYIIEEIEDEGVLEEAESLLVRSALEFDEITAEEIITPRVDIEAVDVNSSVDEVKELFFSTRYSRLPVYRDSVDNVIGIVYQQQFFTALIRQKHLELADMIRPVIHVPPKKPISQIMVNLQREKMHMAIVTDQYGGTLGLITLEDILEELVGEIWDEHDDIVNVIERISDTHIKVNGDVNLYAFFDAIDYNYENYETSLNTVNGFIMENIEKIPEVGDEFVFDNIKCVVDSVNQKRVANIIVEFTDKTLADKG